MAPRIRLSLSKPLPTIRETHEEVLEDSTSNPKPTGSTAASPDLHSSDDYIQSICHLARPTFPGLSESNHRVQGRKSLKTPEGLSWSSSLGGKQQEKSKCKLTNFISNVVPLGKVMPAEDDFWSRDDPLAQIYACTGKLCSSKASLHSKTSSTGYSQCSSSSSNTEPQPPTTNEKATGKPNLPPVFSFPRLPSPRPLQKEAVCSELQYFRRDKEEVLGSSNGQKESSPVLLTIAEPALCSSRGKVLGSPALHCSGRSQSCLFNAAGPDEKEGKQNSHHDQNVMGDVLTEQNSSQCFQAAKKSMIHSWISEHRSIWKEAKIKACLLPAIAEV
ncbi:uncharacterized protein [Heliangelus exortis]|uniref:uncharacterized protein n=1 Tax=Heliangelus exortis TaxID=472823 RepID=UPI003A9379E1